MGGTGLRPVVFGVPPETMDEGQPPDNRTKSTYQSSPTKFGGTPNLTRETRVLPSFHPCHIRSVHIVRKWQQLTFALQSEFGVPGQKLFHDLLVFLRLQAASAVNQNPAGLQLCCGSLEQIQLRGTETLDFFRLNPPPQIYAAAHHAGVRARCIHQNTVEQFRSRRRQSALIFTWQRMRGLTSSATRRSIEQSVNTRHAQPRTVFLNPFQSFLGNILRDDAALVVY